MSPIELFGATACVNCGNMASYEREAREEIAGLLKQLATERALRERAEQERDNALGVAEQRSILLNAATDAERISTARLAEAEAREAALAWRLQNAIEALGRRGGIGGQQVTPATCVLCRTDFTWANTAAPPCCPDCIALVDAARKAKP